MHILSDFIKLHGKLTPTNYENRILFWKKNQKEKVKLKKFLRKNFDQNMISLNSFISSSHEILFDKINFCFNSIVWLPNLLELLNHHKKHWDWRTSKWYNIFEGNFWCFKRTQSEILGKIGGAFSFLWVSVDESFRKMSSWGLIIKILSFYLQRISLNIEKLNSLQLGSFSWFKEGGVLF